MNTIDPLIPPRPRVALPPPAPPPVPTRRQPAHASRLTALGLSALTTIGLAAQFAHDQRTENSAGSSAAGAAGAASVGLTPPESSAPSTVTPTAAAPTTAAPTTAAPTTAAQTTAPTAAASTTAAPTTAPATGVANGTYRGQAFTNRWGTVQVQVVYTGGKISDVQILSYPNSEQKSVAINQRALPTLISRSVSAQSASINSVSGATYTSTSYKQSLQSALDKAKTTI